jgi:hypothetical protein
MSSLWTPGGERPIRRPEPEESSTSGQGPAGPATAGAGGQERELSPEEQAAQLQQLQEQLARTPVDLVIANHAFGLFELAALHLGLQPAQLDQARLAIDALAALVEGLAGRLGEHEPQLRDGLAQLRLAFVQIQAAQRPNGGQATRRADRPPGDTAG